MKLYVLVREDLSHAQRAVQSGHAIAEFLRHYPDSEWNYGSLVLLGVKDKVHLGLWLQSFGEMEIEGLNIKLASFQEPYWDNSLTAFAVLGSPEVCELLKDLPLI